LHIEREATPSSGFRTPKLEGLNSKNRLIDHRGYGHHSGDDLDESPSAAAGSWSGYPQSFSPTGQHRPSRRAPRPERPASAHLGYRRRNVPPSCELTIDSATSNSSTTSRSRRRWPQLCRSGVHSRGVVFVRAPHRRGGYRRVSVESGGQASSLPSSLRFHTPNGTEQNTLFLQLLAESTSRASPSPFLQARLFENKLGPASARKPYQRLSRATFLSNVFPMES
jgi:hypothetical protein